jgi:putative sugar O-methyltransferase
MPRYPELEYAFSELLNQSQLYRPTSFWEEASRDLAAEFESIGIENFRQGPLALSYFVPTYGPPTLGISHEQVNWLVSSFKDAYPNNKKAQLALEAYLTGYLNALADYRVLAAANPQPDDFGLNEFSEGSIGNPIEQFVFDGKTYSRSSLNYLLGLSLLKQHADFSAINTVLEIGGGFGTLGEILGKAPRKGIKYINVDIPPTYFAAEYYLKSNFGTNKVASFDYIQAGGTINVSNLPDFTVMRSWQFEKLKGKVDLFVNFISFQEMEPHVVAHYLSIVTNLGPQWILLRNMREGKQKRTATGPGVDNPVLREDYIRMLPSYRLCCLNVLPYGYRTLDSFHSECLVLERR